MLSSSGIVIIMVVSIGVSLCGFCCYCLMVWNFSGCVVMYGMLSFVSSCFVVRELLYVGLFTSEKLVREIMVLMFVMLLCMK